MLVALLAAFLLASSGTMSILAGFDQAQVSIKVQVEDRTRRTELLSVIEDAERATKEGVKRRTKTTRELVPLLRSHEAGPADIEPVLQRMRADAEAAQERVISFRFELRSRMSREEWVKAFPAGRPTR